MIGRTVLHYRILEKLGEGGMGVVYKALDTKLDRLVALKFLPPQISNDTEEKKRFIHEAKAASALDHPNICSVYEINETTEGQLFISMGYYQGMSLREKIKAGPLPIIEAVETAMQLAEGLKKAHQEAIVHRDLKPANVMLTEEEVVKIVDFGLAKLKGLTRLTRTGTTLGTVAYMSPEQARGGEVDERTDLWSLGVILYEMLTGKLPFRGEFEQAVLYAVLNEEPESVSKIRSDIPDELRRIVRKALVKDIGNRYQTAADFLKDLKPLHASVTAPETVGFSLRRFVMRPKVAIPATFIVCVLAAASFIFIKRQAKVRWAREQILPQIERIVEGNDVWRNLAPAYLLAEQAEKVIPKDRRLTELFSKCSLYINIKTEPAGAKICMKEYSDPDGEWRYLGVSPLAKIRVPVGIFRWKLEKEGYETVQAAAATWNGDQEKPGIIIPFDLVRILDKKESIPVGMVRVAGAKTPAGELDDFFIDRYEVSNRQFKEFLNAGGYSEKKFWKQKFIRDGKALPWEEALKAFVDQTGQPGPSTWQARDFPEGQGDHPVSGISWYEAAAYAEFAGKSLPSGYHWGIARGESTPMIRLPQLGGFAVFAHFSNFRGKGPLPVGSLPGITSYGVLDMAGNVREWCWNETPQGRLIRGGAWDDNPYMFGNMSQAPAMDRSPYNGFRCVVYMQPGKIPGAAFQTVGMPADLDLYKMNPVPDAVFQIYKELYAYDKTELQARVEARKENTGGWILEKVSFAAAYGDERIAAYLFLPQNSEPPFQAVIYFPGSAPQNQRSSADIENYYEFPMFLSFIVKSGRAALFPVYQGTFERITPAVMSARSADANTHQRMELVIQIVKDFRRCVDFLETLPDIDAAKIAYEGMSWGGNMGPLITAVEERLKASVLMGGSIQGTGRPEINRINFIGRVRVPTLMMNGRYDTLHSFETTIKPMFDLLGTPAAHKKLMLYDTDHIPPRNEYIKEILAWLDKYLGPVKHRVK